MYSLVNHGPDLVDIPDIYVKVIERLLEMGADPNKNPVSDNPARQPESTIRVFVFSASNIRQGDGSLSYFKICNFFMLCKGL